MKNMLVFKLKILGAVSSAHPVNTFLTYYSKHSYYFAVFF